MYNPYIINATTTIVNPYNITYITTTGYIVPTYNANNTHGYNPYY